MTTDFQQLADLLGAHRESAALALLNIAPEDVIVVAGAYKGDTVAFLHAMYPENQIHAFEPQDWAFEELESRFGAANSKIHLYQFGLGIERGTFTLYEFGTDACSFLPLENCRTSATGQLEDAAYELVRFDSIGLLFTNIEGYEHVLLPYLEDVDVLPRCKNVVVQVHQTGKYDPAALLRSSELIYDRVFRVWETKSWIWWKRND